MTKRRITMCDFELVDKGWRVVAYPVGFEGVTEGYDFEDAVRMAADWLRETVLDFLMREEEWPDPHSGPCPRAADAWSPLRWTPPSTRSPR